jgi:hypothetical protein
LCPQIAGLRLLDTVRDHLLLLCLLLLLQMVKRLLHDVISLITVVNGRLFQSILNSDQKSPNQVILRSRLVLESCEILEYRLKLGKLQLCTIE